MKQKKPAFKLMWRHFEIIYGDGSVIGVGTKIGGKVEKNIEIGATTTSSGFRNACAIRMSYSLLHSHVLIPHGKWATVSGRDGKQYIYRVNDLLLFLTAAFGKPTKVVKNPTPESFQGQRGILVFKVTGWGDASGHVTLWDGVHCSDHCYFPRATEALLWVLE